MAMTKDRERWITSGSTLQEMKEEIIRHLEEIREDFRDSINYYIRALDKKDGDHPMFILHAIQEEMRELSLMGGLPVSVVSATLDLAKAKEEVGARNDGRRPPGGGYSHKHIHNSIIGELT